MQLFCENWDILIHQKRNFQRKIKFYVNNSELTNLHYKKDEQNH